jgi:hypothetical protein
MIHNSTVQIDLDKKNYTLDRKKADYRCNFDKKDPL